MPLTFYVVSRYYSPLALVCLLIKPSLIKLSQLPARALAIRKVWPFVLELVYYLHILFPQIGCKLSQIRSVICFLRQSLTS